MNEPRLSPELRQEAVSQAWNTLNAQSDVSRSKAAQIAVDSVIGVLWRKLLGDVNDRVASLAGAARNYLEADGLPADTLRVRRLALERALARFEAKP